MMDPAKLKVVELRAELSKRGLDTKGNKAVLVERLRKALKEDTEDNAEEETAAVDLSEDLAHKNAREKTPEPVPSNKTVGRSSRSASATPTKASPVKSSSKTVLSPVIEKQASPIKPLATEKAPDDIELATEAKKPESVPVEDKQVIQKQEKEELPADVPSCPVSEQVQDLSMNQPIIPETIEEVTEKSHTQSAAEETEEKVALLEKPVEIEHEKETESSNTSKVSPDACEINREPDQPKEADLSEEHSALEEPVPESVTNDEQLQNEKMETESDNQDTTESKSEAMDQEIVAGIEENNVENVADTEEKSEARATITNEEETDEKPNDEIVLQLDEQDVEMKEAKVEVNADSERDSKEHDKKDRKDRKRKRSASPQEERAKSPPPSRAVDEPELNETDVVLSWYDSDLNLMINTESFLSATAMHNDGFGYVWAGARATYGFTEGKVYYEAKITEYCDINLQDEQSPHVLRVGWSVQGTSMQLGEEPLTYGFDGTGKISTGNNFSDYGESFGKDDVVGCYLDLSDECNLVISYTINGKDMGPAFTVPKTELDGKPLYPHILTKNCTFVCNFGQEEPWNENILEGYTPVGLVDQQNRVQGPRRPEKTEECEIIMMCGLPAAGKTVWATKYAENNREKMYNILGTSSLIDKMKVIGLPRERNSHSKWETFLDKCSKCLNKLLEMASTRRRNYILDQTNVYASAQRRKMRSFHGYQRRAVVVIPSEDELKARSSKRSANDGEIVSDSTVLDMKGNFSAPVVGEIFDTVEWAELPADEGKKIIEKYNKEGRDAGYGQQQTNKRPRFDRNESQRDSRDSRPNNRDVRDSRDHRDRRNNYSDRNRNSTWRGGSSSGGWRDRQTRPSGGHARHSNSGSGGGYGGSSGSWRGRSSVGTVSSYRQGADRRGSSGHDRRSSGIDRNRSVQSRQGGGWGSMNSYQSSQQSGGWGGSSQSGSWQGSQSQQQGWGNQSGSWSQQQQQWGSWKGYGQGNSYGQGSYSQQGYGNGNWSGWNTQYYNQYWGQQQSSGQTSAAGSQAGSTSSTTPTGNSTTSTGSTYSSYSTGWQDYRPSYGYSVESSNTNTQQQK